MPPVAIRGFCETLHAGTWKVDSDVSVYSAHSNNSVGAEKFRTLRSRLYQIASAQPLKRILITSSTPAEGKTFVAQIWRSLSSGKENRRVLLIDSDLRASRLHLHVGASKSRDYPITCGKKPTNTSYPGGKRREPLPDSGRQRSSESQRTAP